MVKVALQMAIKNWHHPEGIGKLAAKVGNVFKKPAKEVGLQKRLAEGLHFF